LHTHFDSRTAREERKGVDAPSQRLGQDKALGPMECLRLLTPIIATT
jgi:hypothetical protein